MVDVRTVGDVGEVCCGDDIVSIDTIIIKNCLNYCSVDVCMSVKVNNNNNNEYTHKINKQPVN